MKKVRMPSGLVYSFEGNLLQTALRNGGTIVGEEPAPTIESPVELKPYAPPSGRMMRVLLDGRPKVHTLSEGLAKLLIEFGRAVEVEPETSRK